MHIHLGKFKRDCKDKLLQQSLNLCHDFACVMHLFLEFFFLYILENRIGGNSLEIKQKHQLEK